ncbi:DUF2642 domain-containing protein [Brevibacillus sp. B_LB10_24]|uniref:DUF2642 domain-containing protein n=1 Tax=Brevibacillus sp. B_LB10_24 TaxID=3380645 RepID=UPI0038B9C484
MVNRHRHDNPFHFRIVSQAEQVRDYAQNWQTQENARPFVMRLQQHEGKVITVVTSKDNLTGALDGVLSDHIRLDINGTFYHIPNTSILYFY